MERTRESYDQARIDMLESKLGNLNESKWPGSESHPTGYLYASLRAQHAPDVAKSCISDWLELAIKTNGYLTVNTYGHTTDVAIELAVSMDL